MKFFLFILIILHIVTWLLIIKSARRKNNFIVLGIIKISFFYDLVLIIFPNLLFLIGIGEFQDQLRIKFQISFLVFGYLYHFLFILLFYLYFRLFKFKTLKIEIFNSSIPVKFQRFLQFLSIISLGIYLLIFLNSSFSQNPVFISLISIFWYAGLCAIGLLVFHQPNNIILNIILCLSIFVLLLLISIQTGVRGRFLWLPLIFFYLYLIGQKKYYLTLIKILISFFLLMILIPLFALFSMAEYRHIFANNLGVFDLLNMFCDLMFNSTFFVDSFKNSLSIYVERSIGILNNYFLSTQFDLLDYKFLKIYNGILTLFIPTELYLNKPILGSPGILQDMAMYKSMINYNLEGVMGSVLASGHAFWELGYIGIALYPIFYVFVIYSLSSFRLPCFPFFNVLFTFIILGGLITDAFSTVFIPIYSLIDVLIKTCIPVFILFLFYNRIFSLRGAQKLKK